MSEKMTDAAFAEAVNLAQQWWTPEHVGVKLAQEADRARRSEAEKNEQIRALADALERFGLYDSGPMFAVQTIRVPREVVLMGLFAIRLAGSKP